MECCGKIRRGKFCSNCGKRIINLFPLLKYLKYNKNNAYANYLDRDKQYSLRNYEKWRTWVDNVEDIIKDIIKIEEEIETEVEKRTKLRTNLDKKHYRTLKQIEDETIKNTLISVDGNREKAAKILGIGQRTIYRKLKEMEEKEKKKEYKRVYGENG